MNDSQRERLKALLSNISAAWQDLNAILDEESQKMANLEGAGGLVDGRVGKQVTEAEGRLSLAADKLNDATQLVQEAIDATAAKRRSRG